MRSAEILVLGLFVATPAFAHHSDVGMDVNSVVTIEGTIGEFSWRNPHIYIFVNVDNASDIKNWELNKFFGGKNVPVIISNSVCAENTFIMTKPKHF